MKPDRYYIKGIHDKWGALQLDYQLWVNEAVLTREWLDVKKLQVGDQLILYDDQMERLYQIDMIELPSSVHLKLVTSEDQKLPAKHIYLMWSVSDESVDNQVISQATRLGVRNLVPVLNEDAQVTGFDMAKARAVMVEAAEQSVWAVIPDLRAPIGLNEAVAEYSALPLYVLAVSNALAPTFNRAKFGILIGPKTGWGESAQKLFERHRLTRIDSTEFGNQSAANIIVKLISQFGL